MAVDNEQNREPRLYRFATGYKTQTVARLWGSESRPTIVLLHGFMQDASSWDYLARILAQRYHVVTFDLIGHGETKAPLCDEAFSLAAHRAQLKAVIEQCSPTGKAALVGYSMGGRVAASFACHHPESVTALVLESAGLGPRNEEERMARTRKNERLAHRLREEPLAEFIHFWEELPLFETQQNLPDETRRMVREQRLNNDPQALALSLINAGQQCMDDCRRALVETGLPILYLAGEKDVTYTEIARSLTDIEAHAPAAHVYSEVVVVPQVGHNIHLEDRDGYRARVECFFDACFSMDTAFSGKDMHECIRLEKG